MSRLGARHISEMPLKSGLEGRYACLTQEKAKRPNMSGLRVGHV
jgi:hypothetical protein